ncbi:MAG TPA: TetR/AcrR family transcriptional regulator [Giesbergeria sp.]|jgi:AcrR family transcriptional regulator|uniref:TetR family transcriptional regulator n=1 Tax=Acidovorax sp. 210-6 TaxID=2699468 RepID=UPI001389EC4E|nr:TetR/AcrR family transcriptional regulator [Acidovorax sp. 210-6]MBL8365509.1 TetR family transcriptional regulator [Comamonas sp.]MCK6415397.1 TetR/AcrR family transcriptional regulator [Giesbergeria sp.]NCU67403.1 TetR/AcrR family transcriptional regulator [Acidovorax sp. 210-6]HMZ86250.1 TetR/AcrR family transcriptional regulator [Giesbergeria sp.]HNK04948.1 TetR/AcrR family transcriptional regulator [Giesbergeria sp.]
MDAQGTDSPEAPRRARGRPRKLPDARDEGNRRRELLRGAARLFRSRGFAAVSTRDIAAAAGMQSGSPFYHFESKSALLHAVMHEGMEHAVRSQQAALDGVRADALPQERLAALVRHHFEILFGPEGDFIPVMLYEWRSLTPEQRHSIARLKTVYEAPWMPVLQALHQQGRLCTAPPLARLFILGALNWAVQWYRPDGPLSLDALAQQALALFLGPPAAEPFHLSAQPLETPA